MKEQIQAIGLSAILLAAFAFAPAGADKVTWRSSVRLEPTVHLTDAQEYTAMQKLARISLSQAQGVAQRRAPGATLVKGELDCEDGNVVYEIELREGTQERKVIVDAGTGRVLASWLEND